jgi:glycosyltransferase involved in cell wall biosynthesis
MTTVSIIYPADPCGDIPGGIDTFIKGILDHSPTEFSYEIFGITTDKDKYPPGQWHNIPVAGSRTFRFFPVLHENTYSKRSKIPLSFRFTLSILKYKSEIQGDLLEFHRFEPVIAFLRDSRPKSLFVHQDLQALRSVKSDIRWGACPSLFYALERFFMNRCDLIHCVHEESVAYYTRQLPALENNVHFTPTWYDPKLFFPLTAEKRLLVRQSLFERFKITDSTAQLLAFVGRLDFQKDPCFLVDAIKCLEGGSTPYHLLLIGDGVLREAAEQKVHELGMTNFVHFLGVQSRPQIAYTFQGCDGFLLGSNYEGMPIALLEAIATGLPSFSTDVGEVKRIVNTKNGMVVTKGEPADYAAMVSAWIQHKKEWMTPEFISHTVQQFQPQKVLGRIFSRYHSLLEKQQTS